MNENNFYSSYIYYLYCMHQHPSYMYTCTHAYCTYNYIIYVPSYTSIQHGYISRRPVIPSYNTQNIFKQHKTVSLHVYEYILFYSGVVHLSHHFLLNTVNSNELYICAIMPSPRPATAGKIPRKKAAHPADDANPQT